MTIAGFLCFLGLTNLLNFGKLVIQLLRGIFFAFLCVCWPFVLAKTGSIMEYGGKEVRRMRNSRLLGKVTLLSVVAVVCWVCMAQTALAGTIIGWGEQAVNSGDFARNDFVGIAAGGGYSLALKSDDSIVGWGRNDHLQASPPDGNDFMAFAAGEHHSLALRSDGSIVCWGGNWYGQAAQPAGNDFVAIAAGGAHSLALKRDGSIVGWGSNDWDQVTTPDSNDFVAIAAGHVHSVALKRNGYIACWGNNNQGQSNPPYGNDFVAIAAGGWHSLALRKDGSIVGWGHNDHGEATPPSGKKGWLDCSLGLARLWSDNASFRQ